MASSTEFYSSTEDEADTFDSYQPYKLYTHLDKECKFYKQSIAELFSKLKDAQDCLLKEKNEKQKLSAKVQK